MLNLTETTQLSKTLLPMFPSLPFTQGPITLELDDSHSFMRNLLSFFHSRLTQWSIYYEGNNIKAVLSHSSLHIESSLNTLVGLSVQRNFAEKYFLKNPTCLKKNKSLYLYAYIKITQRGVQLEWKHFGVPAVASVGVTAKHNIELWTSCWLPGPASLALPSSTQWPFSKVLRISKNHMG